MSEPESPALNPWFQMWVRPRATIQSIVETNPRRLVLVLASLRGVTGGLALVLPVLAVPLGWGWGLAVGTAICACLGILGLYVSAALLEWTGRSLGGLATGTTIRAALAWSAVPLAWGLLFWIPRTVWFDLPLYAEFDFSSAEIPRLLEEGVTTVRIYYTCFLLFDLTLLAWSWILLLKCLGQVQGFSDWGALGNVILSVLAVVVPLVLMIPAYVIWRLFG